MSWVSRRWDDMKDAYHWCEDKVSDGYHWCKDQVSSGYHWCKDQVSSAYHWCKNVYHWMSFGSKALAEASRAAEKKEGRSDMHKNIRHGIKEFMLNPKETYNKIFHNSEPAMHYIGNMLHTGNFDQEFRGEAGAGVVGELQPGEKPLRVFYAPIGGQDAQYTGHVGVEYNGTLISFNPTNENNTIRQGFGGSDVECYEISPATLKAHGVNMDTLQATIDALQKELDSPSVEYNLFSTSCAGTSQIFFQRIGFEAPQVDDIGNVATPREVAEIGHFYGTRVDTEVARADHEASLLARKEAEIEQIEKRSTAQLAGSAAGAYTPFETEFVDSMPEKSSVDAVKEAFEKEKSVGLGVRTSNYLSAVYREASLLAESSSNTTEHDKETQFQVAQIKSKTHER